MQMDHRRRIRNVMLYLDNNLDRQVSIGALARMACFSPFHFQRVFQSITGETVFRYQQRRRLETAVRLLRESSKSIIDIALTVGYQTPAAFNKAFKKWVELTPTCIRQKSALPSWSSFEPLFQSDTVECPPGHPRIESLPEMQFAFIETRGLRNGTFVEAGLPVFQLVYAIVRQYGLADSVLHWVGMIPGKPRNYTDPVARYRFGVLMNRRSVVPVPLSTLKMEAGRAAIFDHRGPYEYLLQVWALAYNGWLPRSGEKLRATAPYEIYLNNPQTTHPDQRITRVCVPII